MSEFMVERVAKAIMADIKRQMGGGPIPGVPDVVDSWSARGDVGTIDTADLARAAIYSQMEYAVERQRQVFDLAEAYDGVYLLRRCGRVDRAAPKTDIDLEYDACEALVIDGCATWLSGNKAPGIRLTGKPLLSHQEKGE